MHDQPLLAHLGRLRRERRDDELTGGHAAERRRGSVDERLGPIVADDDDVRIVRRVVPAVMRVQAVAGHQLDLELAPDDTLPVWVAVERDGLQRLAQEE